MFWELGEHVKSTLDALGLTEPRIRRWCSWAACWCEARRTWLNVRGERMWAWLAPARYERTRCLFRSRMFVSLDGAVRPESSLWAIARAHRLKISRHTAARWLSELVEGGLLSEMPMDGERWLSLRKIPRRPSRSEATRNCPTSGHKHCKCN